jgi:hypothetical protein
MYLDVWQTVTPDWPLLPCSVLVTCDWRSLLQSLQLFFWAGSDSHGNSELWFLLQNLHLHSTLHCDVLWLLPKQLKHNWFCLIKFLEGKCQTLDLIHANQHPSNNNNSCVSKPTKHAYVCTHSWCVLCSGNHPLYRCKQFRKASSQQRLKLIKQNQLCFNCLGNSHRTSQCKVEWRCKFCRRKHNSLLLCESEPAQKNSCNNCNNERQPQVSRTEQNTNSQSGVTVCNTSKGRPPSQILLATATVYVRDKCGQLVKCWSLLDSASQGHFVTERLVQKIHLGKFKVQIPV